MDKWMRTGLILTLMLCLGCSAMYAAQRVPRGMFNDLKLTADQQSQMKSLFESQRKDEKKDFEKIRGLQETMDQEFLKDLPDESKIMSTANEIKKIQAKLLDKHFDHLFALRKILTPEQFRKFTEKGHKMRTKMGVDRKGFRPKHLSTEEGVMPPPHDDMGAQTDEAR